MTTVAQDKVAAEKAAYTGEPTERQRKAASLINGGKTAEDAMAEAGYGRLFVAGCAKTFPGLLAALGLITDKKAKAVAPAPVVPTISKVVTERETIR